MTRRIAALLLQRDREKSRHVQPPSRLLSPSPRRPMFGLLALNVGLSQYNNPCINTVRVYCGTLCVSCSSDPPDRKRTSGANEVLAGFGHRREWPQGCGKHSATVGAVAFNTVGLPIRRPFPPRNGLRTAALGPFH
jgi:hypothetical protein